jgi:hypothetical protein
MIAFLIATVCCYTEELDLKSSRYDERGIHFIALARDMLRKDLSQSVQTK